MGIDAKCRKPDGNIAPAEGEYCDECFFSINHKCYYGHMSLENICNGKLGMHCHGCTAFDVICGICCSTRIWNELTQKQSESSTEDSVFSLCCHVIQMATLVSEDKSPTAKVGLKEMVKIAGKELSDEKFMELVVILLENLDISSQ